MKKLLISVLLVAMAASVFAGDNSDHGKKRTDPVSEEIKAIFADESDTVISDLTFGEVIKIRLSDWLAQT